MEKGERCWQIIAYGTGLTPITTSFDNESRAREVWDRIKDDPYAGAYCLQEVVILERR